MALSAIADTWPDIATSLAWHPVQFHDRAAASARSRQRIQRLLRGL